MSEDKLVNSIYKLGKRIKKSDLTATEKSDIIKSFNSYSGDPYKRAIKALEEVLGKKDVELLLEKSASLDDINRLLQDVSMAADDWSKSK